MPTILPSAVPMVNKADPLSFAPGLVPIVSLIAYTSSSRIGTVTVPEPEPSRIRLPYKIHIYSLLASYIQILNALSQVISESDVDLHKLSI